MSRLTVDSHNPGSDQSHRRRLEGMGGTSRKRRHRCHRVEAGQLRRGWRPRTLRNWRDSFPRGRDARPHGRWKTGRRGSCSVDRARIRDNKACSGNVRRRVNRTDRDSPTGRGWRSPGRARGDSSMSLLVPHPPPGCRPPDTPPCRTVIEVFSQYALRTRLFCLTAVDTETWLASTREHASHRTSARRCGWRGLPAVSCVGRRPTGALAES